jgi:cytidine deaminase
VGPSKWLGIILSRVPCSSADRLPAAAAQDLKVRADKATLQPYPHGPGLLYSHHVTIDWPALRAAAATAAERAYAPYSGLRVGAAGQAADGQVLAGCNVENASYGLTLCAECGLISALHVSGASRLLAVAVVAGDREPLLPCGRCRQLLLEAGGPGLLVDTAAGPVELNVLLPSAFSRADLASRRD